MPYTGGMTDASHSPTPTLRERKRERTRQAIVDAATDLFERHGYDETTVADIAAAAEIGTRTFFSYFASKEEVLFPAADARVQAAVEAIDARGPDDRPATLLLRALRSIGADNDEMTGRTAALRMRLVRTVPAVRGRGLQIQLDAQRAIAERLREAYPDELDDVQAGALVGAFVGAVTGAVQALMDRVDEGTLTPKEMGVRLSAAVDEALAPWLE